MTGVCGSKPAPDLHFLLWEGADHGLNDQLMKSWTNGKYFSRSGKNTWENSLAILKVYNPCPLTHDDTVLIYRSGFESNTLLFFFFLSRDIFMLFSLLCHSFFSHLFSFLSSNMYIQPTNPSHTLTHTFLHPHLAPL